MINRFVCLLLFTALISFNIKFIKKIDDKRNALKKSRQCLAFINIIVIILIDCNKLAHAKKPAYIVMSSFYCLLF